MSSSYKIIPLAAANQWVHPRALFYDGSVYVGAVDSFTGAQRVYKINPEDRTFSSELLRQTQSVDDHNAVALLPPLNSSDVWRAFLSGHSGPLNIFKTDTSLFSSFSDSGASFTGIHTYAMVGRDGSTVSFLSRDSISGFNFHLSTDGGDTWTTYNSFNNSEQPYIAYYDSGQGYFYAGGHFHPDNVVESQDIFAGRLTINGVLRGKSSDTGYDIKNNNSVRVHNYLESVYTASPGEVTRFYGMNDSGRIVFVRANRNAAGGYNEPPPYNAEICYLDYGYQSGVAGAEDIITETGRAMELPSGANYYWSGASVANDGRIAVTCERKGLWTLEIYKADGTLESVPVPPQKETVCRPQWVNSTDGETGHLVWHEGFYEGFATTKRFDLSLSYGRF